MRQVLQWVFPFLLVAWLYLPALHLPFFWDDVVHFRYVAGASAGDILTQPELVGYYRPLVNLILNADPAPSAPLWHGLLLANHLLNVALVGALARRVGVSVGVAMLVFGVFPFHFQAVVWVLAWFHPLVVSLILLACLAGLVAPPRRSWWLGVAWGAGALAPFVHENGVLTAPLLALLLWMRGARWRQAARLLLPIGAAAGGYVLLAWRLGVLGGGAAPTSADWAFNAAYFAQGFSFPVQFVVGYLGGGQAAVWAGFCVFLCALLWRGGRLPVSLAWFLLASLPAALLLRADYVANAPRLLYLGAVGVALGYAASLARRRWGLVVLAVALILSVLFVRERLRLHTALGAGYAELNSLLATAGGGAVAPSAIDSAVINAPMWLDTERPTFPLGKMGAIFIPDYYALRDFVWLNTGVDYGVLEAGYFYPKVDPWSGHTSGLKGVELIDRGTMQGFVRAHDWIYAFNVVEEARFSARLVGVRGVPLAVGFVGDFSGGVRLGFVELAPLQDDWLQVAIQWQKQSAEPLPFYQPFVHLLCDGALIAQSDADPIGGLYALDAWGAGEVWIDYRYLWVGDTASDCWRVRVGLYDPTTGARADTGFYEFSLQ